MKGLVLASLGVAILGAALVAMIRRIRFLATAVRGTATVTRIRESTRAYSADDPTLVPAYHSYLRFTSPDGAVHEFEHQHGTTAPSFVENDQVSIRYSPTAPAKTAELPSLLYEFRNWFIAVVPGILGLGLLLAGLGILSNR